MGFVLCIAGCPIIWISKLQESIALSMMEAEYNVLSVVMKAALPLQRLFKKLASGSSVRRCLLVPRDEDRMGCKTLFWPEPEFRG